MINLCSFLLIPEVQNAILTQGTLNETFSLAYVLLVLFTSIIMALFYNFAVAGMISSAVKGNYDSNEMVNGAKTNFFRYLWFTIVVGIFVFLLFLLLIIPGIIFAIFWFLSAYVFFEKNEGINASLKQSHEIVRGNWWRVLGYVLLITLIILMIQFVIALPLGIINIFTTYLFSGSIPFFILNMVLELITSIIYALFYPFSIIFFKNFYFALKKEKGIK